ncbi:MAG: hypothetical protein M3Q97_07400 [Bacteroidota bacterium]|nr:hypothetical protein [Bacteroidota bacterium]
MTIYDRSDAVPDALRQRITQHLLPAAKPFTAQREALEELADIDRDFISGTREDLACGICIVSLRNRWKKITQRWKEQEDSLSGT